MEVASSSPSVSTPFTMPSLHVPPVGAGVGETVGEPEGASVGDSVGAGVGVAVVGLFVGACVLSQHQKYDRETTFGQHVPEVRPSAAHRG